MKRQIITTADGSVTIHLEEWNEQYHSKHGAIQEAAHVFLKHGFHHVIELHEPQSIAILEMGFGTGLNAFMTYLASESYILNIDYHGIEAFPVSLQEIAQLNYPQLLASDQSEVFQRLHELPWASAETLAPHFNITKRQQRFEEITDENAFDLIYFDAFGARVQPELWTEAIFNSMFKALKAQGTLVTYAAKGSVRRAMQQVGFAVERLPGPPGKREMLRATKAC